MDSHAPATPPSFGRGWILAAFLAGLSLVAMWPVLGNDFVEWDDGATIYAQPALNPPTLAGLAHFWTYPYMSLYVPVTHSVWWAIAAVTLNPLAVHATSL